MNDVKAAIELVKPIFAKLPEKRRHTISLDLASWLWSDLVFQTYTPDNDDAYRWALGIHLDLALNANSPDDVLRNLRTLTRWLELLGAGEFVQWIRQLIRREAPGTWYVDKNNREQYVHDVEVSGDLERFLIHFQKRLMTEVPAKLNQVMSAHERRSGHQPNWLLEEERNV